MLDYWQYVGNPLEGPSYAHRRVRYGADGARTVDEVVRVAIPER